MRSTLINGVLSLISLSLGVTIPRHESQNALAFAYTYGYSLYAYGNVAKPILREVPLKPNVNLPDPEPNEPGGVGVVRPNADTMYSILFIDLSSDDIVVNIPEMPQDRYWVFPICTPYGDNLINIGNLGVSKPGEYLIQYDPDNYGLETENIPDGFAGVIKYPMAYGLVNSRILTDRSEEDVKIVQKLQLGFNVSRTIPRPEPPIAPPLDLTMFTKPEYNDGNISSYHEAVMKVAAALAPYNPPYVASDRDWVAAELRKAGFNNGTFTQPRGSNLTAAVELANKTSLAFMDKPGVRQDVGNDWFIVSEGYIGKFDSHYEARYQIATTAYLALDPSESVYPFHEGDLVVEEGKSILFTFPEPPKIKDGGFWSLTVYGPDQDLVPNDMEKYMVGDRSNLTFPDGTPVAKGDHREFQVLLQASGIEPPTNWTANWLPITPGGATISVTLRWYGAEEYAVNGSYIHPQISTIDAMRS
ncbi:hypothetical protein CCHR01_01366 [Colletotrichum chrysophilum]|uniref:DUF1254 domain-containing protein n=1 Tax=Colletotrichum chrysophilum TaxID=1836956 RepID=A0AAD9AZD3_9PEZI|nr:hypothetical protein CCHR01_01366 [Colletotrichum chrysophilum]